MLAHSIVSSRLNYANALLHSTSDRNLDWLQVAQNSLARVVCQAQVCQVCWFVNVVEFLAVHLFKADGVEFRYVGRPRTVLDIAICTRMT